MKLAHKECQNSDGFTLLELILSIVIASGIVLIIAGAVRLGSRSVDSGEKRIQAIERFRASMDIINSQVQSAIPLTYDEGGKRKYYFKGERKFLRFTTNYSIWGGQKGYVTVEYKVESELSGRKVLYASENFIGVQGGRQTKLFDAVKDIYFEYFFKKTEEEGKWVAQWEDDADIPDKVRLCLVNETKDFYLIIPMRAKRYSALMPSHSNGFGYS